MKNWNLFQKLGFVLIVLSLLILVADKCMASYHRNATAQLLQQMESLVPDAETGNPADYSDVQLPVLQLDGKEFSGRIRFPDYGCTLPMGHHWDTAALSKYPCRFWGSLYDGTLVVGGKDQSGQFDFFHRMDIGDKVIITDMTGVQFSFLVSRIDRSKTADSDILIQDSWDLTIFARDSQSLEYILLRCNYL